MTFHPLEHDVKVLILGGTTEARELCLALAPLTRFDPILSLAGVTRTPTLPEIPCRIGGFGGIAGLIDYLKKNDIRAVVDATHPFSTQMSLNAVKACDATGCALVRITRPQWEPSPEDQWRDVADLRAAARALDTPPQRVFLTTGRKDLTPFLTLKHQFIVRCVDAVTRPLPPNFQVICERGPFNEDAEKELLISKRIDILVTKNSGAEATRAKLLAARQLGLCVIMIRRPPITPAPSVASCSEALAWLYSMDRGV